METDIQKLNENIKSNTGVLALLRRDFPQCFNKEDRFDIERLRTLIGNESTTREGYGLDWLGKSYASLMASMETETVITPDEDNNSRPENAGSRNVYISGDNLDALKHLLKSYGGSVKCIYIDPPYNTGNDGFVYSDRFSFTAEQLEEKLGMDADRAARVLDLASRRSASHSAWLTFMAPRLYLARDLLTDDGVIFISIDDNEQANLKLLCDSVFGEENFVANFIWKSKSGGANDSKFAAIDHEYVLCYGHDVNCLGKFLDKEATVTTSYNCKDEKGEYALDRLDKQSIRYSKSLDYEIVDDKGNVYRPQHKDPANPNATWRWGKKTVEERYDELVFKNGCVYTKNYKKEAALFRSLLIDERYGRTRTGKTDFTELFPADYFSSPKPVKLIQTLLNTKENDIVLDFFSGSGTTAQAVMQLNAEENGEGRRRFIMVQLPEATPQGSPARNAGYATIDQIGMERIRRAAKKIREENPLFAGKMDLGFKHYTLHDIPQDTLDKITEFNPGIVLADNDILHSFGRETVLATWLVNDGYGFGATAKELRLGKYTAYTCGKHLYLVEGEGFDEDSMIALIDLYGKRPDFNISEIAVFGYGFNYAQTEMLRKNIGMLRDNGRNLQVELHIRY